MELYETGSLMLDISIGMLVIGVVIRACLIFRYYKKNGSHTLTDVQKKRLRHAIYPTSILGLLLAIVSLIFLIIC